ncbi:hypothetical protein CLCR_03762 [Cladophialophora carrionii]|uniref:Uncharacterized protein n=1 Tax=Cladophialophora carrionii TaxID=86049 RepID=A0A1C1CGZ1_9EURO|nr:hypothetical protein CLCR_03762 [Cladophialophora carrionii]
MGMYPIRGLVEGNAEIEDEDRIVQTDGIRDDHGEDGPADALVVNYEVKPRVQNEREPGDVPDAADFELSFLAEGVSVKGARVGSWKSKNEYKERIKTGTKAHNAVASSLRLAMGVQN